MFIAGAFSKSFGLCTQYNNNIRESKYRAELDQNKIVKKLKRC